MGLWNPQSKDYAKYTSYEHLAREYAEDRSRLSQMGIEHYLQTITELQMMAEKEMDSWETIKRQSNTWMPDAAATKKWLETDVIPVLVTEAERRGWKKPA
ncbi:MAG: hypothetical protein IPP74_15160 [Alphaproteobacteria bacterium]|nr:hypothetical protein [Alphaproteobacteria bacterium]